MTNDTFWAIVVTTLLIIWVKHCLGLQDVQIYWSTQKDRCERIEINGEDVGCQELPKYQHYLPDRIWVR